MATKKNEAVEAEKSNLPYYVLMEFVESSAKKVKADEAHKEQFVQDYIAASGYANEAFKAATKESAKKNFQMAKENIDAHFINSGVATCDNLQAIYAPKVEENKTNLDYLKSVMKVMKMSSINKEYERLKDIDEKVPLPRKVPEEV